ncbi:MULTISPECIES: STAS domain-containing protein [Streptomyces]|uniref:Anti-sigma factor antagonist n=1 Tax=Streptomyces lasalocidi TaxID=324833 RepID=A0A4U5WNA0_STRLS|nr:STAS domain-containing protein [Streptomyces lasalocidi]TKT03685.1 STAS domain-containing protein [Streptomyces lasalocidi]
MAEGQMTGREQAAHTGRLSVVATATDGIRVLSLAGELDHDTGEALRQALDVTGTARPRIVVDMRQVTFMDSTGINIFVAAYQAVTRASGWIRLAAPTEAVLRTLQLVGVHDLIECRPTLHEALAT